MRTLYYLVVDEAFKAAHEGTKEGANVLATASTKDGRTVVSLNAVNEFPSVFQGFDQTTYPIVGLTAEDFPEPPLDM